MRVFRRIIVTMAAFAAAFACASVEEVVSPEPVEGENARVTFTASVGVASKTSIDNALNVSWAAGDKIKVFDAQGRSEEFTVSEACDSYSFTSTGVIGEGPYYAVAGYGTDEVTFDKDNGQIAIARPSATTDGTFGSADLIASTTSGTSFTFHHVFALLKMSIVSDDITSLRFTAEGIAASGTTMIGFSQNGAIEATYNGGGNEVAIEGITGHGTFYMAVNPGTYGNGFTIYVQKGQKLMKVESDKAFTASTDNIVNFGTLDGGSPSSVVWTLVTANSLQIGDEIIIAAHDFNFAMGAQSGTTRSAVPVVKSYDQKTLTEIGEGVQVLTLTSGLVEGTFGFYTGEGYLYAASSSKDQLKTQSPNNANGSWSVSVSESGIASLCAQGNNTTHCYLRYNGNSGNGLFSCYLFGEQYNYQNVAIYKKSGQEQQGPQLIEVNAFLEVDDPGAYSYDDFQNILVPLFQYIEGRDQIVRVEGSLSQRFQNLSSGHLAGITVNQPEIVAGNTYTVPVMLYGLQGFGDGIQERTFLAKKVQGGKAWLQEENGTLGLIILTR